MIRAAIHAAAHLVVILATVVGVQAREVEAGDMDALLARYKEYGLPLPPDDAPLVRFTNGSSTQTDSGRHIPFYALGFWLNHGAEKEQPEILVGPVRYQIESPRPTDAPKVVNLENVSLDRVEMEWHSGNSDPLNAGFATMIQCHARGYEKLAARVAELASNVFGIGGPNAVSTGGPWISPRQNATRFDARREQAPELVLAGLAWNYWELQLTEEKTDWKVVLARLRFVLASQPELDNDTRRDLLQCIELTLKPPTSKPGSVEAMIDDLVDLRQPGGPMSWRWNESELVTRIETLGFEAVPALIEHCNDRRLTRSMTLRFNNFPSLHRHIGEVVSDILQEFAGGDLGADWLSRQVGNSTEKDAVQKWWAGAEKLGEEKYAVLYVLKPDNGTYWVNQAWLRVIERRFPARLPEIYDTTLQRKVESNEVAEAIGRLSISKEEKMQLLQSGLQNRNADQQYSALLEIQKIDPALANGLLIQRLAHIPANRSKPVWTATEARVAHLVMESDSPTVWQALLAAAKRSCVSLRMELMVPMDYDYIGEQRRRQRLDFVAAFLDDKAIRNLKSVPKLADGPWAGFQFERMAVRDFAATVIAGILKLYDDEPEPDWTPAEWSRFRHRVETALQAAR